MPPRTSVQVELQGLRELMEVKVDAIGADVTEIKDAMLLADRFPSWERRVVELETSDKNHEQRLIRIERVMWLLVGIFTLFGVPLFLMVVSEMVKGLI